MDLLIWLSCASKEMTEQLKWEDPTHLHCFVKSITCRTFVLFATDYYVTLASEPGAVRKPRFVAFGKRTQSQFHPSLQIESFWRTSWRGKPSCMAQPGSVHGFECHHD